jgi:hypothetical protein
MRSLARCLTALACSAGLAVYGVVGLAAQAPVQAAATAKPIQLPPHVFEPYISPSNSLVKTAGQAGVKYFTLDFLQTPRPGSCTVDWNGDPATPVGSYAQGIAALQAEGGQVVPSFGGASADSDDTELADSCHSVPAIAGQYEHVITTYHLTRLDLDTEEDSLNNYAGIERRNEAIAMVERWAARTGRVVQFIYTIPTNTTGIDQGGAYVLQNAVQAGARIAVVDIMTFDYYDNLPHEMADNTESAVTALFNVLHRLYPGKSPGQLWGMIGLCEDIGGPPQPGVDDYGPAETFTIGDAHTVERWAAARGLAELTFWNLASDNLKSAPYQYSHAFEPFTSRVTARVSSAAVPALGGSSLAVTSQSGNLRTISCPTPRFCLAAGEYGNRATVWDGRSWSAPAPVDPGGSTVEVTSVSCASARFCAAVDTLGRALTWNGRAWSRPVPVSATGLEAVSCPGPGFCVAVDGGGDAVVFRHGSWSRPVRVDPTGTGMQSLSCASPTFCVAGDWNGDVVQFNGRAWSAPRQLEKTTGSAGGGLGDISCASARFCVAVDWEGSELTWNGATWSRPVAFDPDGAGGLISVSCRSAAFCLAVDGSGDVLTWNGSKWSSKQVDVTGDGFESVSCATTSFCVAVDWLGIALVWRGAAWPAPAVSCPHTTTSSAGTCTLTGAYTDGRTGVLSGISCASPSFCAAVDQNGNAYNWDGRRWSRTDLDPIAGVLTGVSCASARFCAAVDGNGYAFEWNGRSWSTTAYSVTSPADRTAPLTAVSCPDASFCVAVDGDGRALTWNGRSWSAPAAIDTAGLTAVSCVDSGSCVAVDTAGRVVGWNGTSWTAPALIDRGGAGLTSVSCGAKWSCLAVDNNGRALTWNGSRWSAPRIIDPRGSGLTAASCLAPGYCVATDWDGSAFVWRHGAWVGLTGAESSGGGTEALSCVRLCFAAEWNGTALVFRPPGRAAG